MGQRQPEREETVRPPWFASPAAATSFGAVVVVLTGLSIPLSHFAHQLSVANVAEEVPIVVVYTLVGIIVARRQPANPLGWMMLAAIFLYIFSGDVGFYIVMHYTFGYHLPLEGVALVLYPTWAPGVALFPLIILLFPDGKIPSRRWRWAVGLYLLCCLCVMDVVFVRTLAAVVSHSVRIDSSGDVTSGTNPPAAGLGVLVVVLVGLAGTSLAFVVHQLVSWRRSTGERRQQLKWLGWGAAIAFVTFILGISFSATLVGSVLGVGIAALPIAVGVSILKYRLYEIDRFISRTLAYAVVTGLVVGVYVGAVTLVTKGLGYSSSVAVAASTLAAAALFNPLRRRVQRIVDQRFNRARYDAEATVSEFAARLREAVDLDGVQQKLLDAVNRAVEPAHASVWIKRRE